MKNRVQTWFRQTNNLLKAKLLRLLPEAGSFSTAVAGLQISRRDLAGQKENCFYRPMLALVVQGFKSSLIGDKEYRYGEGACVVVAVDMPSVIHISEASPEKPFLSLSIALDRSFVTQIEGELPVIPSTGNDSLKSVTVADVTQDLLDAFLRLVGLLETPEKITFLTPMILREIHYHLLCGSQGESLRLFVHSSASSHIAKAISWLRENYREPLRVAALAGQVDMTESTFNRHFRKVTGLSPLQFQKKLRLYEAQRLMLAEDKSAEKAAFIVGYGSPAQFNREYKRQFGEPPHRDIHRLVATGAVVGCKMKYS